MDRELRELHRGAREERKRLTPDPEPDEQRGRIGVEGDPTPDHEYGDREKAGESPHPDVNPAEQYADVSPAVVRAADDLAAHGVVTHRQAVAWVLRAVEGVGRAEAAEKMGCSKSNLDTLYGRAKENVQQARQTAAIADELED